MAEVTRFECRVCWHVYDPDEGDVQAQIPPGTAFSELPENWCCPRCNGAKSGFLLCSEG